MKNIGKEDVSDVHIFKQYYYNIIYNIYFSIKHLNILLHFQLLKNNLIFKYLIKTI